MKKFSVKTEIKADDKFSKPIRKMGNTLDKRFTPALNRAKKAGAGVGLGIMSMTSKIAALAGIAGIGATIYSIKQLTMGFIESTDEMSKFARILSIPIKNLQSWRHASDIAGVGQKLFNKSILTFTKRMGELKGGTGALVTLLKKVSPALYKTLKSSDGTADSFKILMTALSKLKDPQKRAALASAAFSKAGIKMQLMAEGGTKAMNKLLKEFDAYGPISQKNAADSEKAADAITRIKAALAGVSNAIIGDSLPAMTKMIDSFRVWINDNRSEIIKKIQNSIKGIGEELKKVNWKTVAEDAKVFMTVIEGIAKAAMITAKAISLVYKGYYLIGKTTGGALGSIYLQGQQEVFKKKNQTFMETRKARLSEQKSKNEITSKSNVVVRFDNAPRGMRLIDMSSDSGTIIKVNMGKRALAQ